MSLIVNALAGTGKTLTLVEGIRRIRNKPSSNINPSPQQKVIWDELTKSHPESICFTAFTVSAKDEIKKRLQGDMYCTVSTMHSIGYQAIRNEIGMAGGRIRVDKFKTDKLIEIIHKGMSITVLRKSKPGYPAAVRRLVQLSKYMALKAPSDEILISLAGQYDVSIGDDEMVFDTTRKVLLFACNDLNTIDFDDMIWLPVVCNMKIRKYDMLLVDEGQDLNHCEQQLALSMSDNVILVGDRHQAIYGFAGADTESMDTMYSKLNARGVCSTFPLTVTRRCSEAVVREAQAIVPEFEMHPSNKGGEVTVASSYRGVVPGDMILCRTNAPLLKEAFAMSGDNIPVEMLGRNIGESLITLVKMLQPDDLSDFCYKLSKYKDKEIKRIKARKYSSEAALINIVDKCACLETFNRHSNSVGQMVENIKTLFSNGKDSVIRLSSIHQAKGLEGRSIFILRPDILPHPLAKSSWQREQEENLKYVAITRAIRNLTWVHV